MTPTPATPAEDAVQLARCQHVGNWAMYDRILQDYGLTNNSNSDSDTLTINPLEQLIFELSYLIRWLAARTEYNMSTSEVFDHQLHLAKGMHTDG